MAARLRVAWASTSAATLSPKARSVVISMAEPVGRSAWKGGQLPVCAFPPCSPPGSLGRRSCQSTWNRFWAPHKCFPAGNLSTPGNRLCSVASANGLSPAYPVGPRGKRSYQARVGYRGREPL
jgi:hypothetical protein